MTKRICPKTSVYVLVLGITFLLNPAGMVSADPGTPPEVSAKGMVTMVDLGASFCAPCKAMAPFLEKLEKDYKGRAAIVILDLGKAPELSERFGVREIPTQIFYSIQGKEVLRHTGFLSEEAIRGQLRKMGVN